jgi:lipopolysaccharide/colanic/teichoic acid biosynthesis glycosyltransferase
VARRHDDGKRFTRTTQRDHQRFTLPRRPRDQLPTMLQPTALTADPVGLSDGSPAIGLSRGSLALKRAFDLVFALLAVVVLGPLLVLIAAAIKIGSPGPVLFRQVRVGRGGGHFSIWKFRTMVADAEQLKSGLVLLNEAAPGLFKIRHDPRITRVGRVLRATCLDELPQLLNVLRGDMSLVGPRPLIVSEDSAILGPDRRRLQLRPGMTGHWQIMGSSRVPLQEMVRIDCLYVTTWTLAQDLRILWRTASYAAARQGM